MSRVTANGVTVFRSLHQLEGPDDMDARDLGKLLGKSGAEHTMRVVLRLNKSGYWIMSMPRLTQPGPPRAFKR